jgi:arylsulfatase A-like enzyme
MMRFLTSLEAWRRRLFQSGPGLDLPRSCFVALTCGLVFGAIEVGVKSLKYRFDGVFFEWSNPDALWMIPTTMAGFMLAITVAMFVVGARPRRLSLRALVVVLMTVGTLSCIIALKRLGIHRVAQLLLAAGIAVQLARLLMRNPERGRRWLAVGGSVVALAAAACAVWLHPVKRARERTLVADLPAVQGGPPNVLLVVLDVVGASHLDVYGYPRQTAPNLTRLASRGVVFDQAYSSAPWTLPSHAGLFTGRWHTELSTDWLNPLDTQYPTLAEFFQARGYRTGGFVANLLYTTRSTGLDRGFATYRDHQVTWQTWLTSAEITALATKWVRKVIPGGPLLLTRKFATDVNAEFLDWLDQSGSRPFFAFLNYFDAHDPYERFDQFRSAFPAGPLRDTLVTGPGQTHVIDSTEAETIDRYDRAVTYMDDALQRLLDELGERGLLDNTLVIVTADHGEQFFEHGLEGHSNSLYNPLLHVPLIAVLPSRIPQNRRVAEPVSLRDVPATVVELTGLESDVPFPGRSLVNTWGGAPSTDEPILAEVNPYRLMDFDGPVARGPMKAVIWRGMKYILNGDGVEELYDLQRDPLELENLATTEQGRGLLPQWRAALSELRAKGNFRPQRTITR